jgi:hypothetical protein
MAKGKEMTEDVYIVLSPYERAMVHAIQNRKLGVLPINWKAMAEDIKVSENYLKALCTIPLPKTHNEIPVSRVDRAIWSISLGQVLLPY